MGHISTIGRERVKYKKLDKFVKKYLVWRFAISPIEEYGIFNIRYTTLTTINSYGHKYFDILTLKCYNSTKTQHFSTI